MEHVDNAEEDVCSICTEKIVSDLLRLPCSTSHTFHRECILEWSLQPQNRVNVSCPNCREALDRNIFSDLQKPFSWTDMFLLPIIMPVFLVIELVPAGITEVRRVIRTSATYLYTLSQRAVDFTTQCFAVLVTILRARFTALVNRLSELTQLLPQCYAWLVRLVGLVRDRIFTLLASAWHAMVEPLTRLAHALGDGARRALVEAQRLALATGQAARTLLVALYARLAQAATALLETLQIRFFLALFSAILRSMWVSAVGYLNATWEFVRDTSLAAGRFVANVVTFLAARVSAGTQYVWHGVTVVANRTYGLVSWLCLSALAQLNRMCQFAGELGREALTLLTNSLAYLWELSKFGGRLLTTRLLQLLNAVNYYGLIVNAWLVRELQQIGTFLADVGRLGYRGCARAWAVISPVVSNIFFSVHYACAAISNFVLGYLRTLGGFCYQMIVGLEVHLSNLIAVTYRSCLTLATAVVVRLGYFSRFVWTSFYGVCANAAGVLSNLYNTYAGSVFQFLRNVYHCFERAVVAICNFQLQLGMTIYYALCEIVYSLSYVVTTVVDAVMNLIVGAINGLGHGLQALLDFISPLLMNIYDVVTGMMVAVTNGISNVLLWCGRAIGYACYIVYRSVRRFFRGVINYLSNFAATLLDLTLRFITGLAEIIRGIPAFLHYLIFRPRCSVCNQGYAKIGLLCFSCKMMAFWQLCSECKIGFTKIGTKCFTCAIKHYWRICTRCNRGFSKPGLGGLCFTCKIDDYYRRCGVCRGGWAKPLMQGQCYLCRLKQFRDFGAEAYQFYVHKIFRPCIQCNRGYNKIGHYCFTCALQPTPCRLCKQVPTRLRDCISCRVDQHWPVCVQCKVGRSKIRDKCLQCYFGKKCLICKVGYAKIGLKCISCHFNQICADCNRGRAKIGYLCFKCHLNKIRNYYLPSNRS